MERVRKIRFWSVFFGHAGYLIRYAAMLSAPFDAELVLVNIDHERNIETVERIGFSGRLGKDSPG